MVDPTGFAASRFAGFGNDIYTTTNYGFTNRSSKGNDVSTTQTYRKKREGRYGNDVDTTPSNLSLKYLGNKYGAPKNADGTYSLVEIVKKAVEDRGSNGVLFLQLEGSGQVLGFLGGSASIQGVIDFKGHWAIQVSTSGGVGIGGGPGDGTGYNHGSGLSGSIGLNIGYADAGSVSDLNGWGVEMGGSASAGWGGSISYIQGLEGKTLEDAFRSKNITYTGGALGVTFGTPGIEMHGWSPYTWTIASGNIYDDNATLKWLVQYLEDTYFYQ